MKKVLSFFSLFLVFSLIAAPVLAQDLGEDLLNEFQGEAGIGDASIAEVTGSVVKAILSVLGLVALIIFIIAGFQWMTSGGNKEKIQGAQKLMGAAVIGLIIIIIAWAAAHFVVNALTDVTVN
jgi:cbb3-type cytochrome oxidase subunit 3